MKIALIGYGKMGRTIEALGLRQGVEFPLVIDLENSGDLNAGKIKGIDVAVEFTSPGTAPGNILACIDLGVPVVSGTTGWNNRYHEIVEHCTKKKGTLFYASNFSLGVNILFALNRKLAGIMDRYPAYSVSLKEVHHVHKLDAPSGTAISLAEQILAEQERLSGWSLEKAEEPSRIPIKAVREDEEKGTHTVRYESDLDALSLVHEAKSRDAFAAGALMAASFVRDKRGVYGMKDLLDI